MDKTEFIILKNLLCNEKYSRKVLPFIKDEYFDRFNYENYGGTPILGVKGNVIIGHGISNDLAVKNMLLHAHEVVSSNLTEKINEAFN